MRRLIDADAFIREIRKRYCEDCARRKGIKNGKMRFCYEIGGVPCRACDIEDVLDALDDYTPTLQPEPHWIPCSERLPIEYNNPIEFLCTLELEYKNDVRYVDLIVWNGSDWENNYIDDNKYSDYGIDKVVAWMPLSEPYKGVTSIPSECEGDCGWCKPSVSEECKGMTDYGR